MDRTQEHTHVRIWMMVALFSLSSYGLPGAYAAQGDSPLEAYFLPHDTELRGAIGSGESYDYYKVIVPATGRLIINLYDISLTDNRETLNISLFRTTQNSVGTGYSCYWNSVAKSQNGGATPDVIDIPALSRGIYFVQVWTQHAGSAWDGGEYKIKSRFTVFPPVVSDDVGDDIPYALPIVNQLPTIASLSGNHDVDYFESHVPYNTNLTLTVTDIENGGNVDVEVYTTWGVMIASTYQTGNADELLYLQDLVPGQYFIKLFGEGTPQYTLTVTQEFSQAIDILDDVGNDLSHALPLLPGNPSVFCLQPYKGEADVFSVFQPQDGPLRVDVYDVFLWTANEDLEVYILDEYGHNIARSDNGSSVPEHIEINLSRGQYFVAVNSQHAGSGFEGAVYTVNVETSRADVGDAFNQAMQIHAIPYGSETYGYPYIGMVDNAGDTDFFQVVLKDEGFIYLEVDRMLNAGVDVQLFDAYHTLLKTSANEGLEPEMIYVDNLDAGIYFIKVYSLEDNPGQYRLTPTVGTPTSPISDDIGNGMGNALPLVPYRRLNAYLWNDNTKDYFTFTLESPGAWVRVRVADQHIWTGNEDLQLYLYNASGLQLGHSDNNRLVDEAIELENLEAGTYYLAVSPQHAGSAMEPGQYTIMVETDTAPLPSGELQVSVDIQGLPGEILYVPVTLDNTQPDEIVNMSLGVAFDAEILEALGVQSAGLMLEQEHAQLHHARSESTLSVSINTFSTVHSGTLCNLVFRVKPDAPAGSASVLTVLTALLNGASVPAEDGLVTVQ